MEKRRLKVILLIYVQILEESFNRGQSQTHFSGEEWQDKRQWAQSETQEVPSEYEETLYYCEGD